MKKRVDRGKQNDFICIGNEIEAWATQRPAQAVGPENQTSDLRLAIPVWGTEQGRAEDPA